MIDFDIVRLTKDHNVLAFDCGNKDINDFLLEDAYDYQEGLLTVTYLAVNKSHDDVLSYRTGCRFLTVDAHRDAVGFYEKCGFSYFTDLDVNEDTRLMYFDLKPFRDACGM